MEFCKKCGGILIPKKTGEKEVAICRNCGKISSENVGTKLSEKIENDEKVVVVVEQKNNLPSTENTCPKCGNKEAFWWMQQTRSIDEPPTRFYKCTKCKHTWREYS